MCRTTTIQRVDVEGGQGCVLLQKCHNYRTDSWYKLHTHLRCRCLNAKEKSLLVNSYVHVQAKRELRLKARAQRRLREALDALTSATDVSPRTSVSCCLALTSSTRPGGRIVSRSPRRGQRDVDMKESPYLSDEPPF